MNEPPCIKSNAPNREKAVQLATDAIHAAQAGDYVTAIRLIEEAIWNDPARSLDDYDGFRVAFYEASGDDGPHRAMDEYNKGCSLNFKDFKGAMSAYERAIEVDPKFAWSFNNLAWMLATCPDQAIHDGPRAVALAVSACELSNWSAWPFLGTLGAAYARMGDFKPAIDAVTAAIELAPPDRKLYLLAELQSYRDERPFVDEGDRPVAGGGDPNQLDSYALFEQAREEAIRLFNKYEVSEDDKTRFWEAFRILALIHYAQEQDKPLADELN